MGNILFIINPASNGRAGLKAWEAFKSCWAEPIDPEQEAFTERPGQARELAAAAKGYAIIAAVGGDGTVGEVISGIMDRPEPRPKLAVIPCGTGNDVACNAGIRSVADAANALRECNAHAFDLIRVERENECRHAFLFGNAGFTSIPRLKPWMKRVMGAKGAYYCATFLQVLIYRPPRMTVSVDGHEWTGRTFMVMVGNSEWAGGSSMRIAPGARTDDGELNVTIVSSVSLYKVITKLFSSIAKGSHIHEPEVTYTTGKKIKVQSESPAFLDLDGELFETTPATFSVCPRALEIVCFNLPE